MGLPISSSGSEFRHSASARCSHPRPATAGPAGSVLVTDGVRRDPWSCKDDHWDHKFVTSCYIRKDSLSVGHSLPIVAVRLDRQISNFNQMTFYSCLYSLPRPPRPAPGLTRRSLPPCPLRLSSMESFPSSSSTPSSSSDCFLRASPPPDAPDEPSFLHAFLLLHGSSPSVSPVSSPSNLVCDYGILPRAHAEESFVQDWERLGAGELAAKYLQSLREDPFEQAFNEYSIKQ